MTWLSARRQLIRAGEGLASFRRLAWQQRRSFDRVFTVAVIWGTLLNLLPVFHGCPMVTLHFVGSEAIELLFMTFGQLIGATLPARRSLDRYTRQRRKRPIEWMTGLSCRAKFRVWAVLVVLCY